MKFKGSMSLGLDPGTIKFLNEYEDLINSNQFEELYKIAYDKGVWISEMTRAFYESGINPLEHMDSVPAEYLSNCASLTEIELPDTIKRLRSSCFYDCVNVKELVLPKSIERIDDWALANMDNLTELTIRGKLTFLDPFAIYDNPSLKTIYSIPENKELLMEKVSEIKPNLSGLSQARFVEI